MRVRSGIGALLLGLSYLVAAVAAVAIWPWVFAVAVVFGWALENFIRRRLTGLYRLLAAAQAGLVFRFMSRDVLLLVLLALSPRVSDAQLAVVVAGLVAATLLRIGGVILRDDIRRRRFCPVAWRNFEVPGVRRADLVTPSWASDATWATIWLTPFLYAGAVARCLGAAPGVLVAGAIVTVALTAVLDGVYTVDWLRARSDTPLAEVLERLAETLRELAPEVALYFSRPDAPRFSRYIVNVWVPTLERLQRPVLVILRERHHLRSVASERLPIVLITRAGDLETLVPASLRVALYPSNVMKNNHLIRLPGIADVFIGHGDSDKGGSATTLTRIFDETWVSGAAARDRYRIADVGVRDEQIREVGRPQLTEIQLAEPHEFLATAADSGHRLTVLYAPTREGFYDDWNYSSVLTMGATILSTLMDMDGVRVVFRPHPGTGTDDRAFRAEVAALKLMVAARGGPHVVAEDNTLYAAFNEADVLISDISSVITDFLASGKPYIVTDPNGEDPDYFRAKFPSSAGAYLLGPTCAGLRDMVAQALGDDPMAAHRAEVATYLLGDITVDPFIRFAKAVDELVEAPPRG